jgi:hypothetical protein
VIGDMNTLPALSHSQQHDLGTGREGHQVAVFVADAIRRILAREAGTSTNIE